MYDTDWVFDNHEEAAKVLDKKEAEIAELKSLADERNMISDLIMADSSLLLDCFLHMHDANSFWASVRKEHKKHKEG